MDSELGVFLHSALVATGLGATVGVIYQLLLSLRDAFSVEPAPLDARLRWIGKCLQLLTLAGGFVWIIVVFRLLPKDGDLVALVIGFVVYLLLTRRPRARIGHQLRRMIASKDRDWTHRAV